MLNSYRKIYECNRAVARVQFRDNCFVFSTIAFLMIVRIVIIHSFS